MHTPALKTNSAVMLQRLLQSQLSEEVEIGQLGGGDRVMKG